MLLFGYAPGPRFAMGSPKFNTPDGPPKCPVCDNPIRYQERARHEGTWKHQRCAFEGTYAYLVACAKDLEIVEGDESFRHCLAVLACMQHGTDFKAAANMARLDEAFVAEAMKPLIEQEVLCDGVWHYDPDVDLDDPQHCAILVIMWTLCSEGKIVRVRGGATDPSVPVGGGGDPNV